MKPPWGLSWGGLIGALAAGLAVLFLMDANDPNHIGGYPIFAASLIGGLLGHGVHVAGRNLVQ